MRILRMHTHPITPRPTTHSHYNQLSIARATTHATIVCCRAKLMTLLSAYTHANTRHYMVLHADCKWEWQRVHQHCVWTEHVH